MTILPDRNSDLRKKEQVKEMFDNISSRYDLLNHLLSFNIDKLWRKKAVGVLRTSRPRTILDIATGTADFAIAAAVLKPEIITGVDISEEMLETGRKKVLKKGLSEMINLIRGDSESLPFGDNSFDAAIVGFGVRNFENRERGLSEILRVIKPGGMFIVLEFSQPESRLFKCIYNFYFANILPYAGRIISGDRRAYAYLRDSVNDFPYSRDFINILENAGFENCRSMPMTFGIASLYTSHKPKTQA
jgi:demethylmenaquinone methyltransferase / 2-methoxy-6-polyprenyl-1,4-benzoquinol methylase